ncbi:iron ABC transporter substrate-binding protein [Rhodospirillum rubrum]|uniref:metal ABC transporter substrate-binding protein n=1 Tax=Rhodospirillum rubrum TaxID=1085 RepID=UPI001EBF14FE|nr:metal ABC transporter substrate-binding protein [Rhodospirillum rubrum]MBK1663848.1 iron ABC transporter substrate-binding protein [Rhodospirillum rubrum]MBK1677925.1 iron ABC transporter substrate-binding protein [Rhodospirillum rubrum]
MMTGAGNDGGTWTRRAVLGTAAGLFAVLGLGPGRARAARRLKVVTTFTIIADMARNVAGDAAEVVSITKPGAEIHTYQPTPGDLMGARGADLVLWNGLNLELWFEQFFENLGDVPGVVVSQGVVPIGIGEGPYEGRPNPHAWMSPTAALLYVDTIAEALATHDPDNAALYRDNAARYKRRIEETVAPLRIALAALPEDRRWLVTSEGAFSYLARDFSLRELYLWPINADQQGRPQQVRKVVDAIRAQAIPAIFSESTISSAPAEQVARETGARYGGVLYVDSLSGPEGPVPSYLDLLRVTIETILHGLAP